MNWEVAAIMMIIIKYNIKYKNARGKCMLNCYIRHVILIAVENTQDVYMMHNFYFSIVDRTNTEYSSNHTHIVSYFCQSFVKFMFSYPIYFIRLSCDLWILSGFSVYSILLLRKLFPSGKNCVVRQHIMQTKQKNRHMVTSS